MTKSNTIILIFRSLYDLIIFSFLLKTSKLRAKEKKKDEKEREGKWKRKEKNGREETFKNCKRRVFLLEMTDTNLKIN